MEQRLNDALARPNFYRTALVIFAGFALLLAGIGIYGVVPMLLPRGRAKWAYAWRSARPRSGWGDSAAQGLLPVAADAIIGVAGTMFTGRFLERLVEGGVYHFLK